jgi:cation diffusion facilitator family transporter
MGGGLTIYEGISKIRHPSLPIHVVSSYCVLALAAAFETYSWFMSFRELRLRKDPNESVWDEIIGSKDPTVFTVFLEDSAALAGIAVAFLGIALGHWLHNPYLDPIASIVIGLILVAVAVLLGRESGALLLGEKANRSKIRRVKEIIQTDPSVENFGDVLTMQLGPNQVLLAVNVRFRRGIDIRQLESAIEQLEGRIRQAEPTIGRIFIEADALKLSDGKASRAA